MRVVEALILGVTEGLTEFLPVSSTGHLLILETWLPRRSDLFNVAIQAGAIASVVFVYRQRLVEIIHDWRRPSSFDYLAKLAVAFLLTAVLGFAAKLAGIELPESPRPVAVALILGGFVILVAEYLARRQLPADEVTWLVAIAVGIAQVVAGIFPEHRVPARRSSPPCSPG